MLGLFKNDNLIGLDVQPGLLRLLLLKKYKTEVIIEDKIVSPLPFEIFAEGKIKHWDLFNALLSKIVEIQKWHGRSVAICLPSTLLTMQTLEISKPITDDLIKTIKDHLLSQLPALKENFSINFTVLDETEKMLAIYFVAAREKYLQNYVKAINEAGLQVKVVDVDIYALRRALFFNLDLMQKITVGIIYLTEGKIFLAIFNEHYLHSYKIWEDAHVHQLIKLLEQYLMVYEKNHNAFKFSHLIICSPLQMQPLFASLKIFQSVVVFFSDPFIRVKTNEVPEKNVFDWMMACGLSLRGIKVD